MKHKITLSKDFLKSGKIQLLAGASILLALSNTLNAQNSSYNANTLSIGGANNTAFGVGALTSVSTGQENVANGNYALGSNTTGWRNVANGTNALAYNVSGGGNVANGFSALQNNTSGSFNVSAGNYALFLNTTGHDNVATGAEALYNNTTGYLNSAHGRNSLNFNTVGYYNTANGAHALYSNDSGYENTANGLGALSLNISGNDNSANGVRALYSNTTGNWNVANGAGALFNNIGADWNTANGSYALFSNTNGTQNTADGGNALYSNSTGNWNTANGFNALINNTTGSRNVANGMNALSVNTTGNMNTALGNNADVAFGNLSNATALGNGAVVTATNKVRIGNTSVTVIEGQVAYSFPSDSRFKNNIKEEDVKGLEFIKKLRPIVYNFDTKKFTEFQTKNMPDSIRKRYLDQDFRASSTIRQSGFIAQEVEQAAKEAHYDFNGVNVPANKEEENYSVSYSQFVVPLVKAVQEQQAIIEKQNADHLLQMQDLQKQLEEQKQLISRLQTNGTSTGLNQTTIGAEGFSMQQNEPNPFTNETVIKYTMPQNVGNAYMAVYDLSGKQITTLSLNQRGAASLTLTSEKLAAGIYIYSIVADGKILDSKRMVVTTK